MLDVFTSLLPQFILITAVAHCGLAAVVYFHSNRQAVRVAFVIASIIFALWACANFLIYVSPYAVSVRFAYAGAALVYPALGVWALYFLTTQKISLWKPVAIYSIGLLVALSAFVDGFLVHSIVKDPIIVFTQSFGPFYPWYIGFFFLSYLAVISLLIHGHRKTTDHNQKSQLRLILTGFIFFGLVFLTVNYIAPSLGYDYFIDFDVPASIFLIGSIAYAIVRYKLFDTKVLAAHMLIIVTLIVGMTDVLAALQERDASMVLDLLMFTLLLISSVLLVRTINKEMYLRHMTQIYAKNLEKANIRLNELDELKSEFLSITAHQMRSPLTAIKGYTALIEEGSYGTITPDLKEAIHRIFTSTETMIALVDTFLDVSHIEKGHMHYALKQHDLHTLLHDVVEEIRPNVKSSGLSISVHAQEEHANYMVLADRDKLKQVFLNLIDNAVKYTAQGSITITLTSHTSNYRVLVSDTGIGVPTEEHEKIFNKFTRAKDANDISVKGTGLGLYIVREIVSAHDGRVWVESEEAGRGSTFIVELPMA